MGTALPCRVIRFHYPKVIEGPLSSGGVGGKGLSLEILFVSFHASLYRVLSAPSPTPALGFSMVLFSSNNSVTPFL